jgi:hypothetical protein
MSAASHDLPEVLPIFPLTGSLLLPGSFLPLNVFEPRYRSMVADALEGGRHIGMIQPLVPRQDNAPDPEAPPENPVVYAVGCAGHIDQWEQTADGRYLILLRGVSRFRVEEELPLHNGYRRVTARYDDFASDRQEPAAKLDPVPLLAALESFGERHRLSFDLERLRLLPGILLLNGLAAALPFSPAEKQALLESNDAAARRELLLSLMGIGIDHPIDDAGNYTPPVVH